LNGKAHTAIEVGNKLFLADKKSFFIVDLETKTVVNELKNQNCEGALFLDSLFCYTLSHKHPKQRAGFRVYDANATAEKGSDSSYFLDCA